MSNTSKEYDSIVKICTDIFTKKMKDYGSAWRILRTNSLTDQIFIKAKRIRSIEEKGMSKIDEGVRPEYIAIINYCIMALVQLELGSDENTELPEDECLNLYSKHFLASKKLMEDKNHDYDEAWRDMRLSSLTDLILMKLLRTKQIEDNSGKTLISEGVDANYADILNYAVFALIKIEEGVK
ncbi:MAG: hypothetical protein COB15_16660 [Flavobacteriales bacterium]|nr:MAG: hypothetical protein COB15_16660 [Flavobacteriales bacterium]